MKKQLPFDRHARFITPRLLLQLDACSAWYEAFRRNYPHGLKLTPGNVLTVVEAGYPIEWLIDRVCTLPGKIAYHACYRTSKYHCLENHISRTRFDRLVANKAYEVLTTEWM